jgi:hypothetical protein
MYLAQGLHAGHTRSRALGNTAPPDRLEHGSCNTAAGARLGAALAARAAAAGLATPARPAYVPAPKGRARW